MNKSARVKKLAGALIALSVLLIMVAWLAGSFNQKISPVLLESSSHEIQKGYAVGLTYQQGEEAVAANVTAKQATIISSRILARINTINVRAGDKVTKGQLLITLEQEELQAKLAQSNEAVNAANARLIEAKKNLSRAIELEEQGLISAIQRDKSQAEHDTLAADLLAAKQLLTQAKTTLNYSELRSPIDGIVIDRFAEPGDTTQPAQKLLTLYNPMTLRVEAQVREQLALTLKKDQQVAIAFPSINQQVTAVIEEIVPEANTSSRSFLIKASIPFSDKLLVGMYARMNIATESRTMMLIPKTYVKTFGQLTMVWVIENGIKQRRLIRLGDENSQGEVQVVSGLVEGDMLFNDH